MTPQLDTARPAVAGRPAIHGEEHPLDLERVRRQALGQEPLSER